MHAASSAGANAGNRAGEIDALSRARALIASEPERAARQLVALEAEVRRLDIDSPVLMPNSDNVCVSFGPGLDAFANVEADIEAEAETAAGLETGNRRAGRRKAGALLMRKAMSSSPIVSRQIVFSAEEVGINPHQHTGGVAAKQVVRAKPRRKPILEDDDEEDSAGDAGTVVPTLSRCGNNMPGATDVIVLDGGDVNNDNDGISTVRGSSDCKNLLFSSTLKSAAPVSKKTTYARRVTRSHDRKPFDVLRTEIHSCSDKSDDDDEGCDGDDGDDNDAVDAENDDDPLSQQLSPSKRKRKARTAHDLLGARTRGQSQKSAKEPATETVTTVEKRLAKKPLSEPSSGDEYNCLHDANAEEKDEENEEEEDEDENPRFLVSDADDETPVKASPRKRQRLRARLAKGLPAQNKFAAAGRIRGRGRGIRKEATSDESDSSLGLRPFIVDDDEDIESSGASSQDDDGPPVTRHPPEHMFSSQACLGARRDEAARFANLKEAFHAYVLLVIATCADHSMRDALLAGRMMDDSISDSNRRNIIDNGRAAITRIEQDTMAAQAMEFVADGRWVALLTALNSRPHLKLLEGELNVTPQPVDRNNKLATWCNSCCYRPGTRYYHDPDSTLVLFGEKAGDERSIVSWPQSMVDWHVPNDLTPANIDADSLEKRLRRKRVRQWRSFFPGILPPMRQSHVPGESKVDIAGVIDADDDDDENESKYSGDGDSDEEEKNDAVEGFGIAEGCGVHKAELYHAMKWFRFDICRKVRQGALVLMKSEAVDPDPECLAFVLEALMDDTELSEMSEFQKKYGIYQELRGYTNNILLAAHNIELFKKVHEMRRNSDVQYDEDFEVV
jgi:hypothetical protein